MTPEMRRKLAQLPFEEKIRMVGELIRLRQKIKTDVSTFPQSALRNPQSLGWAKNSKK
jgi:hypothetical protein